MHIHIHIHIHILHISVVADPTVDPVIVIGDAITANNATVVVVSVACTPSPDGTLAPLRGAACAAAATNMGDDAMKMMLSEFVTY